MQIARRRVTMVYDMLNRALSKLYFMCDFKWAYKTQGCYVLSAASVQDLIRLDSE